MASIMQNMRYALRQLRKTPGFTLTAVLTLTLGIGATTTMYRVVQGVLLAPLPYSAQDRLVGVAFTFPQEKSNSEQAGTSADFLKELAVALASYLPARRAASIEPTQALRTE